jgi:NAD+ diphosphatase
MLQDIAPYVYSNEFHPAPPKDDSVILSYSGRNVLLKKDGGHFEFPRFTDVAGSLQHREDYVWLFNISGVDYFLSRQVLAAGPFTYEPIRYLRSARPRHLAFAGVTGLSLHGWYDMHRFCGRCGQPMTHSDSERMVYCSHCGAVAYPKICPAVIVAVRSGNRLLVSKYAGREYKRVALIAGYAEVGETIEETVHREVMEEVGIRVKNISYYKSQPWTFTDTLLMGFFCDLDGSDELHVDHQELAMARWVDREDLPEDEEQATLTMEMITRFRLESAAEPSNSVAKTI